MLVLTRKLNERIRIGNDVVLTVVKIGKHRIRIGIEAPKTVAVVRNEITEAVTSGNAYDKYLHEEFFC